MSASTSTDQEKGRAASAPAASAPAATAAPGPAGPPSAIRAAILARAAAKKKEAAKPRPPAGCKPQEADSEARHSHRIDSRR